MNKMKKFYSLNCDEPLSKALTILMDTGTAIFIIKDGKYLGLIDDRNMSVGFSDSSNVKCSKCAVKSPVLYEDSSVDDGLKAFLSGKFKALPVLDKKTKEVLGMVTKVELLKDIMEKGLAPEDPVQVFMKKPVFTVDYSSTIGQAKTKMKTKKVHKLLVTTKKGQPRGIISTFDLSTMLLKPKSRDRMQILSEVKHPDKQPVSEIIRERIFAVDENTSVSEALRIMISKDVSDLLVTKKRAPHGVLSSTDLFKSIKKDLKKQKWNISLSGLNREEDKQFYPLFISSFEKLMKKYSKRFKISEITIHIKKKKSMYEARVLMNIDGKTISFSKNWHELLYLNDFLIKEMKRVLNKKKSQKNSMKKHRSSPRGKRISKRK